MSSGGTSSENFLKLIDNALILHDCSKIKKFELRYGFNDRKDPQLISKIRFATKKSAEKMYLLFYQEYMLPRFFFNNASLVKLCSSNSTFVPNGKVNWECLTTLNLLSCRLADQVMDLILSGSPLLENIALKSCFGFQKLVFASNSLKLLDLELFRSIFYIEISCPVLLKLRFRGCFNVRTAKFVNLPSSLSAIVDFNHHEDECSESRISLIKDILNQLRHVKELRIGSWFMEYLSAIQMGGQFSPVLNIKCLTLMSHNIPGIAYLLRNSPVLEMLVINVTLYDQDYRDFMESYWSDATVFNCLVSHLKTVKIIGFPKGDRKHKIMLNLVQFFLKDASVLEKIVVELKADGTTFPSKVHQELSSLLRCSQSAIIVATHK